MKRIRGFTLVELMVAITVLGVALALAIPSFTEWIRNTKVRTAADSLLNGLQFARSEAVRRNTLTRFQLVDTLDSSCDLSVNGPHWIVSQDSVAGNCAATSTLSAPFILQVKSGNESGGKKVTITSGASSFTFTGEGRVSLSGTNSVDIDVTSSESGQTCVADNGAVRCLRIVVAAGGQVRMCDPALSSTQVQGC